MKAKLFLMVCLALVMACGQASAKKQNNAADQARRDSIALAQRTQQIQDSLNNIAALAKKGDPKAMNEVGVWYYTGKHVQQNYKTAYDWWSKAAQKGEIHAIANFGMCYQYGHGVEKDSIDAVRLYMKSIKEGNKDLFEKRKANADKSAFDAMLIGECYETGVGAKKDLATAAKYFATAASKGSVDGMRKAGLAYLNSKQPAPAFKCFELGAKRNDLVSTYWVGKMLLGDMGIQANKQQAVIYLLKAAESGYPAAENLVGELYATGDGVAKNPAQAVAWFKKAALADNTKGMWNYAVALEEGAGVDKDYDQALVWMAEAYNRGYTREFNRFMHSLDSVGNNPYANYLRGMKYYYAGDMKAANEQFKKVEKAKIEEGKIMQCVVLASNKNPKADPKKAAKELTKLANTNPEAAFYLATLYEAGRGVELDPSKAIALYRNAAEMGYGKAQSCLGDIYYEGRGTQKDIRLAVQYYLQAFAQKQISATGVARLAQCYENGEGGLPKDKKKAQALREYKADNKVTTMLQAVI